MYRRIGSLRIGNSSYRCHEGKNPDKYDTKPNKSVGRRFVDEWHARIHFTQYHIHWVQNVRI